LLLGKERLNSIINGIVSSFSSAAQTVIKTGNTVAAQKTVVDCLKSGGKQFRDDASDELDKLHHDSTVVLIELVNPGFSSVLRSDKSTADVKINLKDVVADTKVGPDSGKIGKIYNVNGTVYYPIINTVTDQKRIIGYVVSWVVLHNTTKTIEQFSRLVGMSADFYIENTDGSLCSNLIQPIPNVPFKITGTKKTFEFIGADSNRMIAAAQLIPNTYWAFAIACSEHNILSVNGVNSFLKWTIVIGIILIAAGFFAAWYMSRTITKPLNQLMTAATDISVGKHPSPVPVDDLQTDEIGKLADIFNTMTEQIYRMHHDLEIKVEERTAQLENVNAELEAFSYSVSHDLRTPLRAISGYAIMLKEDYEPELGTEGKRIIKNIITNAKMMGQLIDDLLSFSRLSKKELVRTRVDMQSLTENVITELVQPDMQSKYHFNVGLLLPARGDRVMIKQVLINLVSNAIKYSSKCENAGIEIASVDEEKRIVYHVKDNGVGFDMAYADKLFGVFQRLHSQEEFEGSGVGLALVKRIIKKHNGDVWAEGLENRGATFYFSLPKF
jgi:signal transduction histidine kinase